MAITSYMNAFGTTVAPGANDISASIVELEGVFPYADATRYWVFWKFAINPVSPGLANCTVSLQASLDGGSNWNTLMDAYFRKTLAAGNWGQVLPFGVVDVGSGTASRIQIRAQLVSGSDSGGDVTFYEQGLLAVEGIHL